MIQPATLTGEKQRGDKKIATYFSRDVAKLLLLLLTSRIARWGFVANEA
jgi:hypothetical protein